MFPENAVRFIEYKGVDAMKLTIAARKITLRPSFAERTQQRIDKLDKFFADDAECTVTVAQAPRNTMRVEATVRSNGLLFRAETTAEDVNDAVDTLIDMLIRQIRRNKTRLEKRLRSGAFVAEPIEEAEDDYRVVRQKSFSVKPLDVDEAILQMNMLGHQFFMFRNVDTGEVNVVYRRQDGDYGLLEPQAD